ncbi:MAG TPA: hypothetical protein VHG72_13915 [Polyangia bacterium]|nr:hypothetical protein [Polyangia bacterium]
MATNPTSKGIWEKTVRLTSGGFIKIEVVGHPLDMAPDDREFVSLIVERVNEYEADAKKYGSGATPPATNADKAEASK